MAYSLDLRERVVAAIAEGEPVTVVAKQFRVAQSTVRDWINRHRDGDLHPGTPGPKGPRKLTADDVQIIRDSVAAQPGITAKQLARRLNATVSLQTVYRHLQRLGLSLKRSR